MKAEVQKEHEWLRRLVGTWRARSPRLGLICISSRSEGGDAEAAFYSATDLSACAIGAGEMLIGPSKGCSWIAIRPSVITAAMVNTVMAASFARARSR